MAIEHPALTAINYVARAQPLDNNSAEASPRRAALGRVNYLFFGNENAGHDFAILYTLVASCEASDQRAGVSHRCVAPSAAHPARDVEDLLPHRWKPLSNG